MEKDYEMKDLYGKEVQAGIFHHVAKILKRFIRAFILIGVLLYFFSFGIAPSESMYPTIHPKDMMIFKNTQNFKRGDIIFFKFPLDEKQMYLKRVIGVGGDEVEVKDGSVLVNGKIIDEPYINESPSYAVAKRKVPKDQYFVLGDNRNNSFDSSQWGFVKKKKCKGKVLAVILPINRIHLVFFIFFSYRQK